MGYPIKQNQTAQNVLFLMISSTDHITGKTSLTPTVTLSKNGAAFAAPSGAVSEIGNGWYQVAGNATDANTLGPLLLHATGTGADPTDDRFDVVAFDPLSATNLGLSALPTANPGALNGVMISGANVGPFSMSNGVTFTGGMTVSNSGGTALALQSTGSVGNGLTISTNSSTGSAIALSNSSSLAGTVSITNSNANGNALVITPGASGTGIVATSMTVANGITANITGTITTTTNLTNAGPDTSGTTTLLSRLTSARAGYLDNLNVGGAVASHADVVAINQSASKHLLLVTVGQYEPGETYTIEMRTFAAADGSAVNADTTPSLTATGQVSGSLSSNLSAASNPATGVYRWTYTPGAAPTLEQIRFDGSATISAATFTLSCYAQTVDLPTAVFTATDQSHLTAIFNKLPANNIADETLLLAAIGTPLQAGPVTVGTNNDKSGYSLAASQTFSTTGSVGSVTGAVGSISGVTFPSGFSSLTTAAIATAVLTDTGDNTTAGSPGKILAQLGGAFTTTSSSVFTVAALANAPAGGGGGGDPWGGVITASQAGTLVRNVGAILLGNISPESSDHTTTTFIDAIDGTTTRVTSVQSPTSRTVTQH